MGLESPTYIHQLNPLWPIGASDPKSQGDDHLRIIKSAIQATFPNITGAMTATHTQLNALVAAVTGLANPSASIGLTAVNGVATTAMRSDGAPALSQAIAPVWSNTHIFGNSSFNLVLQSAGAAADQKNTLLRHSTAGQFTLGSANDASPSTLQRAALDFSRSGVAWTSLNFGNATDNPSYGFTGTGTTTHAGPILSTRAGSSSTSSPLILQSTSPVIFFKDTDGGTDRQNVRVYANGNFNIDWQNDAESVTRSILTVSLLGGAGPASYSFGNATNNPNYDFLGTGIITNGGRQRGPSGLASAPTYGFSSEVDTGIFWNSAGDFRASVLSNSVFSWLAAASGGAKVVDYGGTFQTVGYRNVPQNSQSANYTAVLADSGKHILHPSGGGAGDTFTIPANATVAFDLGTVITFVNSDSNSVTIAITSDTMTLAGTTSTGSRTLAQNGVATAVKVGATSWIISGTGLS